MTTRYVDPAAAGDNNGTSWTHAYQTMQLAADNAVAGDIVYCRGTETLAAAVDFDTNAGSNSGGYIKFIGCNSSGVVDGTRYVLNGNSAGIHITNWTTTAKMTWMENIQAQNTGAGSKHGFYASADVRGCVFINCCATGCSGSGWYSNGNFEYGWCLRCVSYSNSSCGFMGGGLKFLFCNAYDNSDKGFVVIGWSDFAIGCIAHHNDIGISMYTYGQLSMNVVADGNTSVGVNVVAGTQIAPSLLIGSRLTNQSGAGDIGLECNGEPFLLGWNYFEDNTDNIHDETVALTYLLKADSATLGKLGAGETDTNQYNQEDNNEGYTAAVASHNFATNYVDGTDPTARRIPIPIPWTTGT